MPIMLGGAPRQFTILNGTICAAMVLGLRAVYILPLFVVIQFLAIFLTKRDPYFFSVLFRHIRQKKYYDV
jgi:type IV secretion system protein TrbD